MCAHLSHTCFVLCLLFCATSASPSWNQAAGNAQHTNSNANSFRNLTKLWLGGFEVDVAQNMVSSIVVDRNNTGYFFSANNTNYLFLNKVCTATLKVETVQTGIEMSFLPTGFSPVAVDNSKSVVYIAFDQALYCFDLLNANMRWKAQFMSASGSVSITLDESSSVLYYQDNNGIRVVNHVDGTSRQVALSSASSSCRGVAVGLNSTYFIHQCDTVVSIDPVSGNMTATARLTPADDGVTFINNQMGYVHVLVAVDNLLVLHTFDSTLTRNLPRVVISTEWNQGAPAYSLSANGSRVYVVLPNANGQGSSVCYVDLLLDSIFCPYNSTAVYYKLLAAANDTLFCVHSGRMDVIRVDKWNTTQSSSIPFSPLMFNAEGALADDIIFICTYSGAIMAYNGSICPNGCSGNGVCTSNSTCSCNRGYYGASCNRYCDSDWTCSQQGICNSEGQCSCFSGYYGSQCNIQCNALTCPGNSVCTSSGLCNCTANYYPAGDCETYCDPIGTCNGNGHCDSNGVCVCNDGSAGTYCQYCSEGYYKTTNSSTCERCLCATSVSTCDSQGVCICLSNLSGPKCERVCECNVGSCNDMGNCICEDGYTGLGCDTFIGLRWYAKLSIASLVLALLAGFISSIMIVRRLRKKRNMRTEMYAPMQ